MYRKVIDGKTTTENSSLPCQTYIPTAFLKHKPKSGPPCRRQVVHPKPHGESVAKSGTPPLIIFSLICESDRKEVHSNLSNYLFEKNIHGQKQHRGVTESRNSIPQRNQFRQSNYSQYPVQDYWCAERAGHHRSSLPPPVTHIIQIIYKCTIRASIQTKPKFIRRNHIFHSRQPTFNEIDKIIMGVIHLQSSMFWL